MSATQDPNDPNQQQQPNQQSEGQEEEQKQPQFPGDTGEAPDQDQVSEHDHEAEAARDEQNDKEAGNE